MKPGDSSLESSMPLRGMLVEIPLRCQLVKVKLFMGHTCPPCLEKAACTLPQSLE